MKNSILSVVFLLSVLQFQGQDEIKYYVNEQTAALNLPFSNAVIVGNIIYVSGNIGNIPGTGNLAPGGVQSETRQTLENIERVLAANGTSLKNAIKLTVMMADINEWEEMNEIYSTFFPDNKPARSAFGTTGLALDARLEIECIALIINQ